MIILRTDQNAKCELVVQSEDEVVCSWELFLVLPLDEVLSSLWTKIITILAQFQKKIANDIFIVIAAVDYSISCT